MIRVLVSYDYELVWGVWQFCSPQYIDTNVSNANECAKQILELHEENCIKATWAVVGAAIDPSVEVDDVRKTLGMDDMCPVSKHLGVRRDVTQIDLDNIDKIRESELFELASHTYWHKFMNECSIENIYDDFEKFSNLKVAVEIESIVFPRNLITSQALSAAKDRGFKFVRINPMNNLYQSTKTPGINGFIIRLFRYIDSFIPVQEFLRTGVSAVRGITICEGQYFFRADCGGWFLDYVHFFRLCTGLAICKRRGKDFHIWSHPHNFGRNPKRSIMNLNRILKYLTNQVSKGDVRSCLMRETG